MLIEKKYVTFETNKNNNCLTVNFLDENNNIVEQVFTHLGSGDGYKYCVDMTEFIGRELKIEILPCNSEWRLAPEGEISQEEMNSRIQFVRNEDDYTDIPHYTEKLRPLYHYTTQRGWINDPNGCIYFDGLYHMYYQHCPGSNYPMWDNNHWGHAVSKDLFEWTEVQPVLRFPHEASGTGFINRENGKVCVTTSNRIFESNDGGFSYKFKCINTAGNGDPKIFWHEESQRYISVTLRDIVSYSISSSPDLIEWTHESDIENFRECPEMCKYKIEGTDEYKWVLNGGDGAYIIGEFDGHEFKQDPIDPNRIDKYVHLMEATRNFKNKYNGVFIADTQPDTADRYTAYAHQNFDSAPNGRHIRIAWYTVPYASYDMPFNQAMTVPQELSLRYTPLGLRLCTRPVDEIKNHYVETKEESGENATVGFDDGVAFDISAEFEYDKELNIGDYRITYSKDERKLYIYPPKADMFTLPFICGDDGIIKVRALTDVMICEFFFGEGEVYCPLKPDTPDNNGISVSATGKSKLSISSIEKTIK